MKWAGNNRGFQVPLYLLPGFKLAGYFYFDYCPVFPQAGLKALVCVILLLALSAPPIRGEEIPTVELRTGETEVDLESWTGYLKESAPNLDPRHLFSPEGDALFTLNRRPLLSFGITDTGYWFKFRVVNRSPSDAWYLELGYPQLDRVSLFEDDGKGGLMEKHSGDALPVSARFNPSHQIITPVSLPPGVEKTFLIRIHHLSNLIVPLTLYSQQGHDEAVRNEVFFLGMVFGVVLLGLLFSLSVYFYQRWRMFLYHSLFTVSVGSFVASLIGLPEDVFWQKFPEGNNAQYFIGLFLSLGFSAQFTRHFLRLWRWFPGMDRVLLLLFWVTLGLSLTVLTLPALVLSLLGYGLAILLLILFLIASLVTWHSGDSLGRSYLICMSLVLVTVLFMFLSAIDLVGAGRWVIQMMQVSLAGEVLMLAVLLGNALRPLAAGSVSRPDPSSGEPGVASGWVKPTPTLESAHLLQVKALGGMEVRRDNKPISFGARALSRPQVLFMELLLLAPESAMETALCESLWPDADADQARNSLKTTVFRLRQIIGAECIAYQSGRVSLNLEQCRIDALVFAAEWEELSAVKTLDLRWAHRAGNTLALYQGPFLKNYEHAGVLSRREDLRRKYMALVIRLAAYYRGAGRRDEAESLLQEGLFREPLVEAFYQQLMIWCQEDGRWSEGLRVFQELTSQLKNLLGVHPAQESQRIYHQLRAKQMAEGSPQQP